MNETMTLPVYHHGQAYELPLTIVPLGYTYQLHIQVEGKSLIFEKDEQRDYRVIGSDTETGNVSVGFLAAIVATLQQL